MPLKRGEGHLVRHQEQDRPYLFAIVLTAWGWARWDGGRAVGARESMPVCARRRTMWKLEPCFRYVLARSTLCWSTGRACAFMAIALHAYIMATGGISSLHPGQRMLRSKIEVHRIQELKQMPTTPHLMKLHIPVPRASAGRRQHTGRGAGGWRNWEFCFREHKGLARSRGL